MTRLSARRAQQLGILTDKKERPKKLDKPPLRENEIRAAIREWLRWHKWFVVINYQTALSHKGVADMTAVSPDGRTLWIEVKTFTGRLSEYQEKFRDEILTRKGEYLVARSVEDVETYLKMTGV